MLFIISFFALYLGTELQIKSSNVQSPKTNAAGGPSKTRRKRNEKGKVA